MVKTALNSNHWAAILLLLMVVPGFIFSHRPLQYYPVSEEEILQEVLSMKDVITPDEVRTAVKQGNASLLLVDLRSPEEFIVGHIGDAVNIPTHDILSSEAKELFKDNTKTVVLYGGNEVEGCGPWMLLRQLGYKNVKVMLGGYDLYVTGKKVPKAKDGECYDEQPRYDYASYFKGNKAVSQPKKAVPKVVVPRRKKKVTASGGC